MISESEFNSRVDDTLLAIEEVLDGADSDLDYENSGGVLTVICENGQQVIFTRQAPVRQLWLATPEGGFHFDLVDDSWQRDSDGCALNQFLTDTFLRCAGESFSF